MLIALRLKRIRRTQIQGRGVTGSTADFGHRRAALVVVRCGFDSLRPYSPTNGHPCPSVPARSSAV